MIGILTEPERQLISERTHGRVRPRRKRGVKLRRQPKLSADQIDHARKLIDTGDSPSTLLTSSTWRVSRFTERSRPESRGNYAVRYGICETTISTPLGLADDFSGIPYFDKSNSTELIMSLISCPA